jgi:hypothetical protein
MKNHINNYVNIIIKLRFYFKFNIQSILQFQILIYFYPLIYD